MTDYALPSLYAIFLWWSTTIALIYLDGLPRWTFRWTMLGGTVLMIVASAMFMEQVDDDNDSAWWDVDSVFA